MVVDHKLKAISNHNACEPRGAYNKCQFNTVLNTERMNIMTLHEIGPYTTNTYELLKTEHGITKPISEPSILLDKETLTIHRMGCKENVDKKFNNIASRLSTSPVGTEMLQDLITLTFNDTTFSSDDIATIFNATYNCTGCNLVKYIVTNDATSIRNEIEKLKKIGY